MSIAPVLTYGSLDLTAAPYLWEFGGDLGAPENAAEVVLSALQDGDIEVSDRAGNRSIALTILVDGANLGALADAEAALEEECRKERNELSVDPGDGVAAATVFDTFRAQLALVRDDEFEKSTLRRYRLTMRALPHGRSVNEVTATALPTTGTTTTNIDAGSATTGWTGSHTVTASGGSVRTTTGTVTVQTDLWLQRTIAAVDLSTQKYVVVDWSAPNLIRGGSLTCLVDGVAQEKVAEVALSSGYTRSWFLSTDTSATTFRFMVTAKPFHVVVGSALELAIDKFDKSDVIPQLSTGRQLMRYVDVVGSARTAPLVTVSHASTGLGEVLLYTRPIDGSPYTPPLRVYKTSAGATTVDATAVSGVYDTIPIQFTALVPKRAVPDGTYVLLARMKGATAGTATVYRGISTEMVSHGLRGAPPWTGDLTLTTSWQIFQLGTRFSLPTVALSNESDARVKVDIARTAGVTVHMDEAWLFNVTDGSLTWVDLAPGVASYPAATKLWALPPDVDNPIPRLLRGTAASMSDAFSVTVADNQPQSWGDHVFPPGEVGIFTVTTGVANATVSVRYPPNWHTHAAQ